MPRSKLAFTIISFLFSIFSLLFRFVPFSFFSHSFFAFRFYLGQEFVLTFHFDDNEILVYSDDEDRCFQYKFGHKFDIGDIKSVQVWDDVESVDEIIFRYQKNY